MKTITDNDTLMGATTRFGHKIPTYDDGYGPLFIYIESLGNFANPCGIVRAQTWEDAYEICQDEFMSEASETIDDMIAEFGENWSENDIWQEQYGFRPNGPNERDTIKHGIYSRDLNCERLDKVTPELLASWEITLQIESHCPECGAVTEYRANDQAGKSGDHCPDCMEIVANQN